MTITLKGINSLSNKLNRLSNVKGKKAVEEVADVVEKQLRNKAESFSDKGSKHIGKADAREYNNGSYYVEIGLKNDNAPWEEWKHLYFHHYGYNQFLFGKPTGKHTNMHQFWFTDAIDNMEQRVLKDLRENLRKEIKEAMK